MIYDDIIYLYILCILGTISISTNESEAASLVLKVINEASTPDPIYSLKIGNRETPGNKVQRLSEIIKCTSSSESEKYVCNEKEVDVGGYIIFSLLKKYRQIARTNPNSVAAVAVQFLITLKTSGLAEFKCHTFLDF